MDVNSTATSAISAETAPEDIIVCYSPTMITSFRVWQGNNPLNYSLPLFVLQLTLVVAATRFFVVILKPFRQPRVIAEIMGGLLLGPSVLGRNETFAKQVFPLRSVAVIEAMANIGLIYFLFLVGLEMDISVVKRTGRKAIFIAIAGMAVPFAVGAGFSLLFQNNKDPNMATFILFLGVALSVTAFPVLARILAELKLFNTELGHLALSTSLINDVCAWVLLVLAMSMAESRATSWAAFGVILSNVTFVVICFCVVRPAISCMLRTTPDGESFTDLQICVVLSGVMVSSFVTDAMGSHAIFGAYVYGLAIPNGPIVVVLVEKLEDFVSGLLLPLFFAISGLKTNITVINGIHKWASLFLVIPLAYCGKVLGTLLVSLSFQIPARDGVILGLLMNTKGLIEIIVLNVAKDQKVLGDEIFAMMVIITVIMTGLIAPIVTAIYKPTRRLIPSKRRTIQGTRLDSELRVMVCVHNIRNVPTIINLLHASHPKKKSPLCIFALHLVELTGRVSAMLIVHATRKSGRATRNQTQTQTDHIINAFESFEENEDHVSIHPLTVVSPYSTMHEDISSLAEDKRVSVIIIPFHKQQTVDGGMQDTNPAFRLVNQNLQEDSPCSVGILVDRGLNGSTNRSSTTNQANSAQQLNMVVVFFGGPDDREALAYAWRMIEHPGVSLTVTHFIPGQEAIKAQSSNQFKRDLKDEKTLNIYSGREKILNEEFINEFKRKTANVKSVVYTEKVVNNGEETVAALRSMKNGYDLFIIGKDQGEVSPLTAGFDDWSECPELGAIGDLLASSDFGTTASVLVMQQCIGMRLRGDEIRVTENPRQASDYANIIQHLGSRYTLSTRAKSVIFDHSLG